MDRSGDETERSTETENILQRLGVKSHVEMMKDLTVNDNRLVSGSHDAFEPTGESSPAASQLEAAKSSQPPAKPEKPTTLKTPLSDRTIPRLNGHGKSAAVAAAAARPKPTSTTTTTTPGRPSMIPTRTRSRTTSRTASRTGSRTGSPNGSEYADREEPELSALINSPTDGRSSRVGTAMSRSGKRITSKIGSLDNVKHTPGGGTVQIMTKKLDLSNVHARCGSLENARHKPGGGDVKIVSQKIDFANVQARCGSLENAQYKPGGGSVKITTKKIDLSDVQSRCGSLQNVDHRPGGGVVKIVEGKIDVSHVTSKCGSTANLKHKPAGGNIKIFSEKLPWVEKKSDSRTPST